MHLNATLREYGIQGIIENNASSRRVNLRAFRCDLMEYLKGGENHHLFKGSYMREYSWAEETLGELTFNFIHDASERM